MTKTTCPLYSFLQAAKGNWRISIFIECSVCPYGQPICGSFLMAMDSDGRPVLISVNEFSKITGQLVQKDECLSILKGSDFEALYSLWLMWRTASSKECAVLQLIRHQSSAESLTICSGCHK